MNSRKSKILEVATVKAQNNRKNFRLNMNALLELVLRWLHYLEEKVMQFVVCHFHFYKKVMNDRNFQYYSAVHYINFKFDKSNM